MCPRIGGAAAECEDWVLHLGPLIVQSLLTELDPDTLCNELNLCGTGTELLSRILVRIFFRFFLVYFIRGWYKLYQPIM